MAQQIQLFDGSPVTVSLRSRKKVELANPAMTMLFMSQPQPFEDYIITKTGKLARSKGYEARKLTDWSDNYQRPFHRHTRWDPLPTDPQRFKSLLSDKFEESLLMGTPKLVRLNSAANRSLMMIKSDIQHAIANSFYASQIKDIAAKGVQQIIRIAGILHYMCSNSDEITPDYIESARAIYLHYFVSAENFYALDHQLPGYLNDAYLLYQFLADYTKQSFYSTQQCKYITLNAIKAYGPFKASNTSRLRAALELLQNQNVIFIQGSGMKTQVIFLGKSIHHPPYLNFNQ